MLVRPFEWWAQVRQPRLSIGDEQGDLSDLQKTIKDSNTYKGINFIQVVSSLAPQSGGALEDHLEPDLESRPEIRLWSASESAGIRVQGCSDPMPSREASAHSDAAPK